MRHGRAAKQRLWLGAIGHFCGCQRRLAKPDSNSNRDSNCHRNTNSDAYGYTDGNSNGYSDGDCDRNANGNTDTYPRMRRECPDEQEPVTWLQHPPIKIIT